MRKIGILLSISLGFTVLSAPLKADILDLHQLQDDPTYRLNVFGNKDSDNGDISEKSKKSIDRIFPSTYQKLLLEKKSIDTGVDSIPPFKHLPMGTMVEKVKSDNDNLVDPIKDAVSEAFNAQSQKYKMFECSADVVPEEMSGGDTEPKDYSSWTAYRFSSSCKISY